MMHTRVKLRQSRYKNVSFYRGCLVGHGKRNDTNVDCARKESFAISEWFICCQVLNREYIVSPDYSVAV